MKAGIARAAASVPGPRSFSKTVPLWFVTNVMTPVTSYCAGHATSPNDTPLGRPFDLRAGSSAVLDGGLKVAFERVPADSRCPLDALCIRAGDATVALTISQDGRKLVEPLRGKTGPVGTVALQLYQELPPQ